VHSVELSFRIQTSNQKCQVSRVHLANIVVKRTSARLGIVDAKFPGKGPDALAKFLFILRKICHKLPQTSAPGDF